MMTKQVVCKLGYELTRVERAEIRTHFRKDLDQFDSFVEKLKDNGYDIFQIEDFFRFKLREDLYYNLDTIQKGKDIK